MSAAMRRKRASSFFEDPSQAETAFPPPSKRARFRGDGGGGGGGGGSPLKPRGAVDPDLVAVLCARFPSVRPEKVTLLWLRKEQPKNPSSLLWLSLSIGSTAAAQGATQVPLLAALATAVSIVSTAEPT